jgi:hypothetical protein
MFQDIMDSLTNTIATFFFLCLIMFPLAVWKIIDIIIWLCNHISISYS